MYRSVATFQRRKNPYLIGLLADGLKITAWRLRRPVGAAVRTAHERSFFGVGKAARPWPLVGAGADLPRPAGPIRIAGMPGHRCGGRARSPRLGLPGPGQLSRVRRGSFHQRPARWRHGDRRHHRILQADGKGGWDGAGQALTVRPSGSSLRSRPAARLPGP